MAILCPKNMAVCLIHYQGLSGKLVNFSRISFSKVIETRSRWILLDGPSNEVAKESYNFVDDAKASEFLQAVADGDTDNACFENFKYHRACYSRFTDITKIARAEKRKENKGEESCNVLASPSSGSNVTDKSDEILPKKTLRSAVPKTDVTAKNRYVLPAICIICNDRYAYYTDKVCIMFSVFFRLINLITSK